MSKHPDDQLQAAFEAARAEGEQMPSAEVRARVRAQFLSEARGENVSPNGVARLTEQEGALPATTVQERKHKMNRRTLRFVRVAAAALLGVVVVGGLLWASPSLRALAQEIISFFVQGESDEQPGVIFVSGDTAANTINLATWSLEEIIILTDFDMRVPTFMPEPYQFTYAIYGSYGVNPVLYYECPLTTWSIMIWQSSDEELLSFDVGESAVIEEVPIRDTVGEYVRGFWRFNVDQELRREQEAAARERGETISVPATMVWSNEIERQQLVWREDGVVFSVNTATMTFGERNPCALTKDDYVAIAEGLRPASEIAQYAAISRSRTDHPPESTSEQNGR